ncbi:MAG: Prepilin-type N-terminal cleavage/methylation protein [Acidobacteria bacterium]|nr:Prepilin-type N-terminal cleavage/methylation protein [Acidobacteriota bacterium]
MQRTFTKHNQAGFSLIEMMIAVTVMVLISAAVVTLMKGSMIISTANYELTDAQQSLRTSQEYINRDLMNAGDGLKTVSMIYVPSAFVASYITLTPIVDLGMPAGVINLGILTSDNQVPAGTAVVGASPATTILSTPNPTDRQTILEIDPQFIPIAPSTIDSTGTLITLPSGTDMTQFTVKEIYYISSSLGGTFATITAVNSATRQLTLANGDLYGLNLSGAANLIKLISTNGTLPTSLQRIRLIHYYVNANKYLMRRVFGAKCSPATTCAGYQESIIAEHVLNVQFNYSLDMTDGAGNVVQPTATLATKSDRINVRQVEVTVTVETPHALQSGSRSQLSMSTSTSVRNMQFRQATNPQ